MKMITISSNNTTNILASKDDLPIFDSRGNILNKEAQLTFGKNRQSNNNRIKNKVRRNNIRNKDVQDINIGIDPYNYTNDIEEEKTYEDREEFNHEYNEEDLYGAFKALKHKFRASIKYRILVLSLALKSIRRFIRNLMKLPIHSLHIDPKGMASIVYIKSPKDIIEEKQIKYFIENSGRLFGSHLEYIDTDKLGNTVYKINFGTDEQYGDHLKRHKSEIDTVL